MANWEGVNEFVAVVDNNSFTHAAKRLGLSTAQVSRSVAALEKRLGTKLLTRTTRVVSPTEAGQTYYRHCKPILEELQAAERVITDLQAKPHGKLFITAPVTYGEQKIAPLVNDFAMAHSEVEVRMHLTNRKVDLVTEGFDVAIRLGKLDNSSLIARKLASRAIYTCASPSYLAKYGEPHSLSEVHHHQCLMGTAEYWHFQSQGKDRPIKVSPRLRCNSGTALIDAALKGMGIIQLPDYYVTPYLETGELVQVLSQFRVEDEGIWAVYPHTRHLSPKVRLLIDTLVQGLTATELKTW